MQRAISTLDRNLKREQDLSKNVPTDDLLLFGQATENTAVDNYVKKQYDDDLRAGYNNPEEQAIEKAFVAAKSGDIARMEDALEEDIPINVTDEYGNTLLLVAAQQGNKRMCKVSYHLLVS